MKPALINKVDDYLKSASLAEFTLNQSTNQLNAQIKKLEDLRKEHVLCVQGSQALKDVRPLLSVSAIQKAQELANQALQVIFETDATLKYVEEDQRFVIVTQDGETDLLNGNGGGYLAVISFIFQIFILIKSGKRRFLAMDEQFTMLSDAALERFIYFLRKICKDLDITMMLITHDARIQLSDVDHCFYIEDGRSKQVK